MCMVLGASKLASESSLYKMILIVGYLLTTNYATSHPKVKLV